MPDDATTALAAWTAALTPDQVPPDDLARLTRHHLDAVGCALGGLGEPAAVGVRRFAATVPTPAGVSVPGLPMTVGPEQGAFAASAQMRQLDFNDSFRGGGHPSDLLPAVLAAAELGGASGALALAGMYAAYEVFAAMEAAYPFRRAGWDHGTSVALGAALGAGVVFGLDQPALVSAIGMAVAPTMALRATRTGALSNWKGCATAAAAAAGLFAARLAAAGVTGPDSIFDGSDGLHRQVPARTPLAVGKPVGGRSAVARCSIKRYPVVTHAQAVIDVLREHRDAIALDALEAIEIQTHHDAWTACGGGSGDHDAKWRPASRETADHSLPFACALSLVDGDVTAASFGPSRWDDPRLLAVIDRITVAERSDLTARYPEDPVTELRVRMTGQPVLRLVTGAAAGSPDRPLTDAEFSAKFRGQAEGMLDTAAARQLENMLWDLSTLDDVGELTALYRAVPDPSGLPAPGNGVRYTRNATDSMR